MASPVILGYYLEGGGGAGGILKQKHILVPDSLPGQVLRPQPQAPAAHSHRRSTEGRHLVLWVSLCPPPTWRQGLPQEGPQGGLS